MAGRDQSYGIARINGTLQWIFASPSPGWAYQDTRAAIPQGQWSHVAVCYDGVNVRAYLNGTLVSSIAASGPITPVAMGGDFRIGCRQTGPQLFFAGSITDVTVYAHALSGYDVQMLAGNAPALATTWFDGNLPPGAQVSGPDNEGFTWTTANPAPFSASRCHPVPAGVRIASALFRGLHGRVAGGSLRPAVRLRLPGPGQPAAGSDAAVVRAGRRLGASALSGEMI